MSRKYYQIGLGDSKNPPGLWVSDSSSAANAGMIEAFLKEGITPIEIDAKKAARIRQWQNRKENMEARIQAMED